MSTEEQVVRLSRLASQLYGDLAQLPMNGDHEQQALQLIADAFEKVGEVALQSESDQPFASELVSGLTG